MTREISLILDRCLLAIQAEEATVASCLQTYPQHGEALEALLKLAAHSHQLLAPEAPSAAFVQSRRVRLLASLQISQKNQSIKPRTRLLGLRPAYVLAAVLLVFTLLMGGVGAVSASADSLPGDSLYRVKLMAEQIRLVVSLSADHDALLLVGFAETRISEVDQLLELKRYDDLALALEGLDQTLNALGSLEASGNSVVGSLDAKLEKHLTVLQRVLGQVPENAKGSIERAIERSTQLQEAIHKMKDDGHPRDSAPGQFKKQEEGGHPGRGKDLDKDKRDKEEKP